MVRTSAEINEAVRKPFRGPGGAMDMTEKPMFGIHEMVRGINHDSGLRRASPDVGQRQIDFSGRTPILRLKEHRAYCSALKLWPGLRSMLTRNHSHDVSCGAKRSGPI